MLQFLLTEFAEWQITIIVLARDFSRAVTAILTKRTSLSIKIIMTKRIFLNNIKQNLRLLSCFKSLLFRYYFLFYRFYKLVIRLFDAREIVANFFNRIIISVFNNFQFIIAYRVIAESRLFIHGFHFICNQKMRNFREIFKVFINADCPFIVSSCFKSLFSLFDDDNSP